MARRRVKLTQDSQNLESLPLTPLMDIIFLVTIFFVLTAGASLNTALDLDLPKAETGTSSLETSLRIIVRSPQSMTINEKETSLDGFPDLLSQVIQESNIENTSEVTLLGSEDISYGLLVRVMDNLRSLGFYRISLITQATSQ